MPCAQHSGGVVVDGCDACILAEKASGWLAWLEHRIDELDGEAALVAEHLEATTASRDDIAHHLEHGTLTPSLLLELIRPFVQPGGSPARSGDGQQAAAGSPASARPVPPGVTVGLEGGPDGDGRSVAGRDDTVRSGTSAMPSRTAAPLRAAMPRPSAGVVLSFTGALLVLVAAIVFTAVSWGRLGERGRVVAMLGFLAVSVAATAIAHRRRMRWTAETLAWLTASLAAVEMAAMTAFDIAIRVDTVPVVVLLVAASFLGMSAVLAVICRSGDLRLLQPWQASPAAVSIGIAGWAAGLGYEAERVWWGPIVAAVAALLYAASRRVQQSAWWAWTAVVTWAVSCIWSIAVLDGSWDRLLGAGVTTALVLGTAAWQLVRQPGHRLAMAGAAGASFMLAAVPAFNFRRAGTMAVDVSLAVLGAVALAAAWGMVAGRLDRRLAATAALPLVGTAVVALDRAPTGAVALGLLALLAGIWAWRLSDTVKLACAAVQWSAVLLWTGYFAHAVGLPSRWSATVVSIAASVAAAFAVRRRVARDATAAALDPAHYAAIGLMGAGLLAASENAAALSTGAAAVAVACMAVLDRQSLRRAALPAAAVATAVAWASLMEALEVSVVEAVTLPVGAVFVVAGELARRWWTRLTSWMLAPGLGVAALGTMAGVMEDAEGITRWMLLLVAGAAVAAFGAWRRLQAPLVIGTAAAVFAALSQLGPWAVGLPRWVTIGVVGAALLAAGARFEAVRGGVQRMTTAFRHLH